MSELSYKVAAFDFTDASQNAVSVSMSIESQPPSPSDIVFLFFAVGAEEPVLVAQGKSGSISNKVVNIAKTKELVGGGPGNKPVALIAYACWTFTEAQGRAFIKANTAISAKAATIYLK